jgi:peptide-methionine (R)-S-oxide reductase
MSGKNENFSVKKSDEEWRKELDPAQYQVLRHEATERAGSSPLNYEKRKGEFRCAGCGALLFDSSTKYESGSGWPSFWAPKDEAAVATTTDGSHGMVRTEVHCAKCGGHLGHLFPDGPQPTGDRYCMNGAALKFEEKK